MRSRQYKRFFSVVVAMAILVGLPSQSFADAAWTIFRDTIGGSLAGLLVGTAIAVAGDEWSGEPVRVGFVAGTFLGLGLGIYQAVKESAPAPETGPEKESFLIPEPVEPECLSLTSVEARDIDEALPVGIKQIAIRLDIVTVRF
jgi:hypothetical protein